MSKSEREAMPPAAMRDTAMLAVWRVIVDEAIVVEGSCFSRVSIVQAVVSEVWC